VIRVLGQEWSMGIQQMASDVIQSGDSSGIR
jgi:hypothetical protein